MGGKIWSEFQCTKDGALLKFSVRNCTEERMEDATELFFDYLLKDEALQKISGVAFSEDARNECKPYLIGLLRQKTNHMVVCVEETTGKIVGASCMALSTKHERDIPTAMLQTNEVKILFKILSGMPDLYNIGKTYTVDKWYSGLGIVVHPDYRGLGVGSALVRSRRHICKELGVPLTTAWMTSLGTQKAAARDGWETPFEIDSREFAKHFNATPSDGIAPTFKVMVAKP
ncbi:uncharacterized protein LOC128673841 [Plodia interpunctella]|uniref:uncharacterized protein LOC128673841 n=1 Tax=Plodia interpunctella TaxID=58824 RepID=UPI002367576F|nr:uncharacterized protein LOC128673841 [Plodia interpunctella]